MLSLPYTICFCIQGNQVLMIYRERPPNQYLWNGIGGKIEGNETPLAAIKREIFEEAEITVSDRQLQYAGLVTWNAVSDASNVNKGMYAFLACLDQKQRVFDEKDISEGKMIWKDLSWVCDKQNHNVVETFPISCQKCSRQRVPNGIIVSI